MAAKSKTKRAEARRKHILQKRRARYQRILKRYAANLLIEEQFHKMLGEMNKLNCKYLEQLHSDLRHHEVPYLPYKYRDEMLRLLESYILERTLLK